MSDLIKAISGVLDPIQEPYKGAEKLKGVRVGKGIPVLEIISPQLRERVEALSKDHMDLLVDYIDQRLQVARQADPIGEWCEKLTRPEDCVYGASQFSFAEDPSPEKIASGGNRSGKTMSGCGIDVIIWSPDAYPEWFPERYRHTKDKPRYVWVACKDRKVQVEPGAVQDTILSLIPPGQIKRKPKVAGNALALEFIEGWDGSRIIFKVYDATEEVFMSAGIQHLHFDEEPPEKVYIEAMQRGLETFMTMIITYTPVKGVTWLYERLIEAGLMPVYDFATEDNPIVDLEELERRDKGLTKVERLIRRRGKTIPIVGKPRFDISILADWAPHCVKPFKYIELIQNPRNPDGKPLVVEHDTPEECFMPVALYVDPRERKNWSDRWVIGVDSSDGVPGGAEQAAVVWDRHLKREAAVCHGRWDLEKAWCPFIKWLSMFFLDAFVNPERNNMGVLLVKYLVNSGVPLYIQEKAGSSIEDYHHELGWYTTTQAKSQAEAHAVTMMNELGKELKLQYEPLVHQLLTYERQPVGTGRAAAGCLDDIVIAWLLSLQMDLQAPVIRDPRFHSRQKETEMWDRARKMSTKETARTSFMGA